MTQDDGRCIAKIIVLRASNPSSDIKRNSARSIAGDVPGNIVEALLALVLLALVLLASVLSALQLKQRGSWPHCHWPHQ